MTKKLLKMRSALLAFWLLLPWPVVYAYDNGATPPGGVQIEAAEPSAAPQMNVFGRAIGSITPGDLFHIDNTGTGADVSVTLYLTNADDLIHHYRYLILKTGLYVESSHGVWEKAPGQRGRPLPDTYLTLKDVQTTLTLAGYARYRLTIDSGNFYSFPVNTAGIAPSPRFYLTVNQA